MKNSATKTITLSEEFFKLAKKNHKISIEAEPYLAWVWLTRRNIAVEAGRSLRFREREIMKLEAELVKLKNATR